MLKSKTKITSVGDSKYILIPYDVLNDSSFPFKEDEDLEINIVGDSTGYSYIVITSIKLNEMLKMREREQKNKKRENNGN